MDKIERAVDDIRRKWVPDGRVAVFEISLLPKGIAGITSSRDARAYGRRLSNSHFLGFIPKERISGAAIRALVNGG